MKLELFDFIDNTLLLLNNYNKLLVNISEDSVKHIKDLFSDDELFLNISYRIKSEKSLREKIIKNNFFFKYREPEEVILNLSDLIGIRVECRFIKDETYIFNEIKKEFTIDVGNGYFKADKDFPLKLRLADKQPQIQQNGFEIYKIDGIFEYGKNEFHFELQIKSMVNVFWGEIDHKILYKNYTYMLTENFFKDMMSSIKDSLSMVDRQLMILYDHVSSMDASAVVSAESQLNYLLSKIIHDVFSKKVKEEFDFVFNFKSTTDVIVDYLRMKAAKNADLTYGENFVDLINKINQVAYNDTHLEEYIEFEKVPNYNDEFSKNIGNTIIDVLNKDFSWNLFFKIIYQIEGSSYSEILENFLYFLRYKYSSLFLDFKNKIRLENGELDSLEDKILNIVSTNFNKNFSINYLLEYAIETIERELGICEIYNEGSLCENIEKSLNQYN